MVSVDRVNSVDVKNREDSVDVKNREDSVDVKNREDSVDVAENALDLRSIVSGFADRIMDENDLPGVAIGISLGDESVCTARGLRDYTRKGQPDCAPLMENDIFHCASVSKLFTSSAIMKLVECGVLNLYDRLRDLIPELHIADKRFEEIRLWNMLTHTSGLGDVSDYHWEKPLVSEDALREYVLKDPECVNQPMLWDPMTNPEFYDPSAEGDSLFRYSNVAYEMLGYIASLHSCEMPGCSGLSYEDFVMEYLLKPAGMTSSTMKTFDREGWTSETGSMTAPNMARPHIKLQDRSIVLSEHYPYTRQHAPSSTLTSNLPDLLAWGRAHMSSASGRQETLLHRETYDSIWRSYATVPNNGEKMGLGWFMRKQKISGPDDSIREYTLYGHEGTDDGFRASFWLCPELDMVTVVLSNLSGAPVKRINKRLFEAVAG
ncbi:MAG: serine hydrolase domain-containing protein, partial [Lentihominibacter sp.]